MLDIKNLHATSKARRSSAASTSRQRRRSARHHGAERLRQEHAGPRPGGHAKYEVTEGEVPLRARTCSTWTGGTRPRRRVPGVPVPGRNPRREQHLFPQGGAQRHPQASRPAGARRHGVHEAGQGEVEAPRHRSELLSRAVNEGFSGGEKKRNEIFQMAVLEPKLAILDETDSGLDIDALKLVADGVNALRGPDRAIIVVTHYQRLLNYIVPDYVHVLSDGRIVKSGGKELALELEKKGYGWIETGVVAGRSVDSAMTQRSREKLHPARSARGGRGRPALAAGPARSRRRALRRARVSRRCATRSGGSPTWRRLPRRLPPGADAPTVTRAESRRRRFTPTRRTRLVVVERPFRAGAVAAATACPRRPCRLAGGGGRPNMPTWSSATRATGRLRNDGLRRVEHRLRRLTAPSCTSPTGSSSTSRSTSVRHPPRLRARRSMSNLRALIVRRRSTARSRIVETYVGARRRPYFTNAVTEVFVGESARRRSLQGAAGEPRRVSHRQHARARRPERATFSSHSFSLGGKLVRNDVTAAARRRGRGVHAERSVSRRRRSAGRQPHDHRPRQARTARATRSTRASSAARRAPCSTARSSSARTRRRPTPSRPTARCCSPTTRSINTKPQLEIFADDVKCTHGAAIGQLDEDAIFYLRARGLTYFEARDMLIHAFAGEILDRVKIEPLRAALEAELYAQLAEGPRGD